MATTPKVSERSCSIRFPEISGDRANVSASSLIESLRDIDPSLVVSRERDNPNAQDAGTVLTIILGSAPAAAVAAGLASWIRMKRVAVRITTADQSVDVSGDGANAARIIEAVFKKK